MIKIFLIRSEKYEQFPIATESTTSIAWDHFSSLKSPLDMLRKARVTNDELSYMISYFFLTTITFKNRLFDFGAWKLISMLIIFDEKD